MNKISIFQIILLTLIFKLNHKTFVSLYEVNYLYKSPGDRLQNLEKPQSFSNLKKESNKRGHGSETFNLLLKREDNFCTNPKTEYLNGLLSDYQFGLKKIEQEELRDKLEPVISNHLKNRFVYSDNSQCNVFERNLTSLSQQSLCPWKYVVTFNIDRYPPYRSSAKCTCDSCQSIEGILTETLYNCYPVYQRVPSLVKRECGSDGYYVWKPELEVINVACVCGHSYKYFPHL